MEKQEAGARPEPVPCVSRVDRRGRRRRRSCRRTSRTGPVCWLLAEESRRWKCRRAARTGPAPPAPISGLVDRLEGSQIAGSHTRRKSARACVLKDAQDDLTPAGPIVFQHTPRPRGEGGWCDPLAVWPLIELELREKKRACRALRDAAINT